MTSTYNIYKVAENTKYINDINFVNRTITFNLEMNYFGVEEVLAIFGHVMLASSKVPYTGMCGW